MGFEAALRGVHDRELRALLLETRPLFYTAGADTRLDRPSHVRSASSVQLHRDSLVLVQDDANFIAVVKPSSWQVDSWTLPAGTGGRRQFDDTRGNKSAKLDLEAAILPAADTLLAFGSGSTTRRESVVLMRLYAPEVPPRVVHVPRFYAALREEVRFAGSELNLEGAAIADGLVRLFNRGNGARRGAISPVNATLDLSLDTLMAHLRDPVNAPVPALHGLRQYELGAIGGLALSFTDAAAIGCDILFTAVAERSPDATRDGPVTGSAIGRITGQTIRWAPICGDNGTVLPIKVEGIAADPADPRRVFIVIDHDDPARPAELGVIRLAGPWQLPDGVAAVPS